MTSRRGRGEDSVYPDGDRWRGAAFLGYGPDGRRIRKKVSGATKAEVLPKLRDLRIELNAGLPVPDDPLTVAQFLDRWLTASLPGQATEKTLDSYGDMVGLHMAPSLGRKFLQKLRALRATSRTAGRGHAQPQASPADYECADGVRHPLLVLFDLGLDDGDGPAALDHVGIGHQQPPPSRAQVGDL